MRRLTYILAIAASASALAQSSADTPSRWLDYSLLRRNVAIGRYDNPALMKDRYDASLTTIGASWLYDDQQQARIAEEGDGSNRADISAEAYIKKGANDIWGRAGYAIGQRRNVMLNESSDYSLIYPYVTADLVGGDLHEENYQFSGGFAHRLKGGVTLGATAGYEALLAYRTIDPRPRNLTSDLDFAVGMQWRWLAVAVKAGKYKQTNVVKFYNETSQPTVYHATGLGTDYYRFRGTNTDSYYNGRNFGAQLDANFTAAKVTDYGVHAAYDRFSFDKVISSLNELPMASVREQRFSAGAHALARVAPAHSIAVEASALRLRRDGNENIFGEAENNIYPEIASLTMFRRTLSEGKVRVAYEYLHSKVRLQASVSAGYAADCWRYTEPERTMKADGATMGAGFTAQLRVKRVMLTADMAADVRLSASASWTRPEESQSVLTASAERLYDLMSNSETRVSASLRADYSIKPQLGIFCRLGYAGNSYGGDINADSYAATIGFAF